MSLGIFNRIFNLLEDECRRLDLEMAARLGGEGLGGASFQRYLAALKSFNHTERTARCSAAKGQIFNSVGNVHITPTLRATPQPVHTYC